jgi:hypothetical protein
MNNNDKELRNTALHLALTQLQTRFEHLAQAIGRTADPEAYIELVTEYYPSTEQIIEEAGKYTKFVNATE